MSNQLFRQLSTESSWISLCSIQRKNKKWAQRDVKQPLLELTEGNSFKKSFIRNVPWTALNKLKWAQRDFNP